MRIDEDPIHEGDQGFGGELARMHSDDASVRINGDERWPRAHGVGAPDAKLPVVDRGVNGVEPDGGIADTRRLTLGDVLAAVHADNGKRFSVSCLELPQLREHVDAVDSAVRPEIEE